MCITLSPIERGSEFIVVNLEDDIELQQLRTVITYSNATAPFYVPNQVGPTPIGWFLPIFDVQLSDIKIYDVESILDIRINQLQNQYRQAENVSIKSNDTMSFDIGLKAQTLTFQNGAQVIGAANPHHIMAEIANVNPAYHDQFLATFQTILNSVKFTMIEHCPCLIFLYETDSARRNSLTYSIPFNKYKQVILPTVINDNIKLDLPATAKREIRIMWGGQYDGEYAEKLTIIGPKSPNTPFYVYGMLTLEEYMDNGWIALDYNVSNPNNTNPYWDTEATKLIPLFS